MFGLHIYIYIWFGGLYSINSRLLRKLPYHPRTSEKACKLRATSEVCTIHTVHLVSIVFIWEAASSQTPWFARSDGLSF